MRDFLINTHKSIYLLSILAFSCFSSSLTESINIPSTHPIESSIDSTLQAHHQNMIFFQDEIDDINNKIKNNISLTNSIKDSLRIFQQLDISGETTDKDIINSLIRIQSKLNLIEEKLFYSDSLYFNLLNDLVLIESQIEDLNLNLNNITELSIIIGENKEDINIDKIKNYKDTYDSAVGHYMNKEYDKSLEIFKSLILFDVNNNLSDNAQFWIAQIFYIQKKYNLAIDEYKKVALMGDKNKAPDAEYKIALSYFNLDMIADAMKQFNIIIINYPENIDLVKKSKKYIERYR